MKLLKNIGAILMLFIFSFNFLACNKDNRNIKKDSKKQNLNICIDVENKNAIELIDSLVEKFKNKEKNIKVKIIKCKGDNKEKILKEKESDIIFTSRNKMLELKRSGLIQDLKEQYSKLSIPERYYNIVLSYGTVDDIRCGIGLLPNALETFYNKKSLENMGIKNFNNIEDLKELIKIANNKSIKIPVIGLKDTNFYTVIASLLIGNETNKKMDDEDLKLAFEKMSELCNKNIIKKDTFIEGTEKDIEKLKKGEIPIVVGSSYYINKFNSKEINILKNYGKKQEEKNNVPILIDAMLCLNVDDKNLQAADEFIKFVFEDKTQKGLVDKGFVTGNKNANKQIKSEIAKVVVEHISNSSERNIPFIYGESDKVSKNIEEEMKNIISGNKNNNEINKIIQEVKNQHNK